MRAWLVAALLAALMNPARADPRTKQAQVHYQRAQVAYDRGDFEEAAREWNSCYALVPRPELLFNLGQAYHKLGNLEKARDFWGEFLDQAPPHDPYRPTVQKMVAEVSHQIEARKPPAPQPPIEPPPAPPPVIVPPATPPVVTPNPPVVPPPAPPAAKPASPHPPVAAPPPPPEERRGIRRLWWLIPVAVVVAAAAAVGIFFALRPPPQVPCDGRSLGCVTF